LLGNISSSLWFDSDGKVMLNGLFITAIIAAFAGFPIAAAVALGLPLALSSTAQVLPMLQSAGRLRTPFGERAFAILLFQDLSIIPLITIIAVMSLNPADATGPSGWLLALYTAVAVVRLIAAGRFLIRPLFRLIGSLGEREMFVVAALFTVVASAAVMEYLGLSTALGAFIAGVMLADSPYRHELETDVEPFRSILLGLFFLAVGMMLDLGVIAERPLFVASMALALIAVKTAVIFALALAFRMDWRGALGLGLLLSQGGEFGFVLFAQARSAFLITPDAASLFGAIVTVSMATTPFLVAATQRFRDVPVAGGQHRDAPRAEGANAIIVGYGRFGQTVGQLLLANGIPVTLIDTDVEVIDTADSFDAKVYFGDGTRLDLLRQAGANEAQLILFCMDGDQLNVDLIEGVHEAFPNAALYVRAFDRRTVIRLKDTSAACLVREVMESAVKMARLALEDLEVSQENIDRSEDMFRRSDKERLKKQIESGDIHAAQDQIFTNTERKGRS